MASVKIVHYTNKVYTDGSSPIILQVIQKGKIKRKVIAAVWPEQWNDEKKRVYVKKHPNYAQINTILSDEFNRVEKLLMVANGVFIHNPFGDSDKIEEELKVLTYWEIAELYLNEKKKQSGWTYITFKGIIDKFSKFVNNPNLLLSQIDEKIIKGYLNYMQGLNNTPGTMKNNFKILRFVSEYGHKNKYDTKPDALHNFKLPTADNSPKKKLDEAELDLFAKVKLTPGTKIEETRDIFLLAVYLRGIRISDILQLKHTDIKKGRLLYKSGKNGKHFDIKLIDQALDIVARYKQDNGYIFSFFKWKQNTSISQDENEVTRAIHLKSITAHINNNLKEIAEKAGINKNISTHIARHTFAKMALDKIKNTNISMDLLGHSSLKVHEAYVRSITQSDRLDDAADDIFSL